MNQAPLSKKQEVFLAAQSSGDTVWCVEASTPTERFKCQGNQVRHSCPLLLKHVQTQQWLASDKGLNSKSPFGREQEVYAHSHLLLNKTQNLMSEREGRTTSQNVLRNQGLQNVW